MRVALIGSGWIQDFHARGVLAHPGAELVAVANRTKESGERVAREFGAAIAMFVF